MTNLLGIEYLLTNLVAFAAFGLFLQVVGSYIKVKFFSPLSKYPGPFWAGFTSLWKLRTTLSKKQHLIYKALHEKYGPVVRDGPYSLSYADATAMKKIYGLGKNAFPRGGGFAPGGLNPEHPPVFFSMTPAIHQKSKRRVAGAYSMSSILQMETMIDSIFTIWYSKILSFADTGAIDFSQWTNYLTLDIISRIAYGHEFGFLEKGADVDGILEALQGGFEFLTVLNFLPPLKWLIFNPVSARVLKLRTKTGFGFIFKKAEEIVDKRYIDGTGQRDLVRIFMEYRDSGGNGIHRDQLRGEVLATLIAGADTTSNSIMGIVAYIMQSPRVISTLQAEISAFSKDLDHPIPSYTQASKLPYLSACISEALRLSPAIANIFAREVPSPGAPILEDEIVPEGTDVGVNNWVMGRDRKLYGDDAEFFRPERWLDEKTAGVLKEYEFAFGHGARVCIGRNIALVEVYKAVLVLFRDFEILQADPEKLWTEEAKLFLYKTDFKVFLKRRSSA